MRVIAAVLVTLSAMGAAQSQPASTAQAVLSANHRAVGPVPTAGTVELIYSSTSSGMTGPLIVRYDLATGAYAEEQDAGS